MDETSSPLTLADYYSAIKAEHEANNAWSAEQAQKAMDYQTQMSNTAHQREVADLRAAGLNPVLSAGGSGASSGSGVQAQRGDENVTALFGLTKMALDASIESSKAMNNVAHYVSGASGYSSGSRYGFNTGYELSDAAADVGADLGKRFFGINQATMANFINALDNFLGNYTVGDLEDRMAEAQRRAQDFGYREGLQEWYYKDHPEDRPSYTIYGHGRPVKVVLYPERTWDNKPYSSALTSGKKVDTSYNNNIRLAMNSAYGVARDAVRSLFKKKK